MCLNCLLLVSFCCSIEFDSKSLYFIILRKSMKNFRSEKVYLSFLWCGKCWIILLMELLGQMFWFFVNKKNPERLTINCLNFKNFEQFLIEKTKIFTAFRIDLTEILKLDKISEIFLKCGKIWSNLLKICLNLS